MLKNRLINRIWTAIILSCCLSACTDDEAEKIVHGEMIRLSSKIASTSRVTDQSLQSTQIVEGQMVGVTIAGAESEHENVSWVVGSDGSLTNMGDKVYWGTTDAVITAYHPYHSDWYGTQNAFWVNTDQSIPEGYLNSDLLWATATASPTASSVALDFVHKLAKVNVTLTSEENLDLSKAVITICGTDVCTGFDTETGELFDLDDCVDDIKAGVTTKSAYTSSAIIVPQTVASGTKFIRITLGDKDYHYVLPEERVFESGQAYNYTLKIKQWDVESVEPSSEYQLFEVEKDGVDAIITGNGQYALLKETPANDALMLVIGRCGTDEQSYVQFDAEGYLKAMAFEDGTVISFFYTPNGVCMIDDDNEIVGEIPYSDFPEISNAGQTRASGLTRNEFMMTVDFVCNVIDKIKLTKDIKDAIKERVLKTELAVDLIRECADKAGIPSNYIVDSVDALIGLVMDTNKFGRICELVDMRWDYDYFGWASVKTLSSVIEDKMNVKLSCEIRDLSDKSYPHWAKTKYGESVDYTYTVGMNVYDDPTTFNPVYTVGKSVTGNGEYSLDLVVEKKYEEYYFEPYLKVEGTIEIDRNAAVRAKIYIAPSYKEGLFHTHSQLGKFERTIYGERDWFMYDYNLRMALVELYKSTNGDSWNNNDNWCSDKPIIEWAGVSKGYTDAKLISIDLNGYGLVGKIDQVFPDDIQSSLWVGNNQLTSVNVSGSAALSGLSVNHMKVPMTSVNASGCTSLERMYIAHNEQLSSLNVSGCTSLEYLNCYENQLTSLNVEGCTALIELNCHDNQLTSLDVSGYTSLQNLYCYRNPLEKLDASGCTSLHEINLRGFFDSDNDAVTTLTSLNVDGCSALYELDCRNNQLTSLSIVGCKALGGVDCVGNPLKTLYFENCPNLDPGYSFHTNGLKLESLTINNSMTDNGQHVIEKSEIKTIRIENCSSLGRVFFEKVKSEHIEFLNCNFNDQGSGCDSNCQVATLCFNNCRVPEGRLDNASGNLVIKNCNVGAQWVIDGNYISISSSTIEGYPVSFFSGSKEAFEEYWDKLTKK